MRISDWSSDVCSSDLTPVVKRVQGKRQRSGIDRLGEAICVGRGQGDAGVAEQHEGAVMALRLRIDGKAVGRHHAQARPLTHQPEICQLRYDPQGLARGEIGSASSRARACQYGSLTVAAGP